MRLIPLFFFFIICFGCSQGILNQNFKEKTSIKIYYSEFFGLSYKAKIIEYENGNGFFSYHSQLDSKAFISLTKEDFNEFYRILDTNSLMNIPQDTAERGFDGTDIFIEIRQNAQLNKLGYWSPTFEKSPEFCTLFQAINSILRKKDS